MSVLERASLLGHDCRLHGIDRCSVCREPAAGPVRGTEGGRKRSADTLDDWSLEQLVATQDDGFVPYSRTMDRREVPVGDDLTSRFDSESYAEWQRMMTDYG